MFLDVRLDRMLCLLWHCCALVNQGYGNLRTNAVTEFRERAEYFQLMNQQDGDHALTTTGVLPFRLQAPLTACSIFAGFGPRVRCQTFFFRLATSKVFGT